MAQEREREGRKEYRQRDGQRAREAADDVPDERAEDDQGRRQDSRHGQAVEKLIRRHPTMPADRVRLEKRDGGVGSSERQQTGLEPGHVWMPAGEHMRDARRRQRNQEMHAECVAYGDSDGDADEPSVREYRDLGDRTSPCEGAKTKKPQKELAVRLFGGSFRPRDGVGHAESCGHGRMEANWRDDSTEARYGGRRTRR